MTLNELISAGGCTLGDLSFSSFGFISVQGSPVVGPANISVNIAMQSPLPGLNFNSTPLVFAPSMPIEVEIAFTAASAATSVLTELYVTPGSGLTGGVARAPVISFACAGGPAAISSDGSVSCPTGPLLSTSSSFQMTSHIELTDFASVGVVNDILIEPTGASFGELTNLMDQFQESTSIPEPSPFIVMTLVGLSAVCASLTKKSRN